MTLFHFQFFLPLLLFAALTQLLQEHESQLLNHLEVLGITRDAAAAATVQT
jgi:hypothetical protein